MKNKSLRIKEFEMKSRLIDRYPKLVENHRGKNCGLRAIEKSIRILCDFYFTLDDKTRLSNKNYLLFSEKGIGGKRE